MRVRRTDPHHDLHIGANIEDLGDAVTLIHLGRGGVQKDGTLDPYNQYRIRKVLHIARQLNERFPDLHVTIILTGKCNRAQDRSSVPLPATEAGAAMAYAKTLHKPGDMFVVETEEISTSTVGNGLCVARQFHLRGPLVILTDPLHYLGGRVEHIMQLIFPHRKLVFVELPGRQDVTRKEMGIHLASTVVTRLCMLAVVKGDLWAIERRQKFAQWLCRR